tara:strand:+ start:129 stop:485 length:357 start_codon:yes stop_codon:yes gene_type:complete
MIRKGGRLVMFHNKVIKIGPNVLTRGRYFEMRSGKTRGTGSKDNIFEGRAFKVKYEVTALICRRTKMGFVTNNHVERIRGFVVTYFEILNTRDSDAGPIGRGAVLSIANLEKLTKRME